MTIRPVRALDTWDWRGRPTLSAEVELEGGIWGEAKVPSGASTGKHEAVELRDADGSVRTAAANVDRKIAPALTGMSAEDQAAVDRRMIELDGSPDKSRLGANAILGVSCAVARAAAAAQGVPLWRSLAGLREASIPLPMINILSGGLHAGRNFEFQDFLAVPHGFATYSDSLHAAVAVHRAARELLEAEGYVLTGVADEGGWGPRLPNNESALDILTRAISAAGVHPGAQVSIAIEAAATHFYADGQYHLNSQGRSLTSAGMVELFCDWVGRYPVVSIEDGLAEDDWDGWRGLTEALGARVQLVGDDLFTTNLERLDMGVGGGLRDDWAGEMGTSGTPTRVPPVDTVARTPGAPGWATSAPGGTGGG